MAEWKPIETCPKQKGVSYLLWGKNVYLSYSMHLAAEWTGNGWECACMEGWFYDDSFTHWQHLPTPPQED